MTSSSWNTWRRCCDRAATKSSRSPAAAICCRRCTATRRPDVVLLDVSMPGMDGLETLKAVRLAHPNVQVIMLSGRQAPATIVDADAPGRARLRRQAGRSRWSRRGRARSGDPERGRANRARAAKSRGCATQVGEDPEGTPFWGPGSAMQHVMAMVERVADSDVSVLLRGESGVGKEVIARELHRRSGRRLKPFVKVNAAALPSELLESELFGHERGAFTGAQAARIGKFEFANHGTLMLDEIGEMPRGAAGQAAARAAGQRVHQARKQPARSPSTCASSPPPTATSSAMMRAGDVPRGPLLPAAGHRAARSATARAARGDSAAHRVFPREVLGALRPAATAPLGRAAGRAVRLCVAGQRPRARERHQALRDSAG